MAMVNENSDLKQVSALSRGLDVAKSQHYDVGVGSLERDPEAP